MMRASTIRRLLIPAGLVLVAAFSLLAVSANSQSPVISVLSVQEREEKNKAFIKTPEPTQRDISTEERVAKGLAHLVTLQDAESGAWKGDIGLKFGIGTGAYQVDARNKPHIGITALACMALVAGGNTPTSGLYADNIRRGTKYILANVRKGGQIVDNGTRMYSNAFAALYLAEIYGMFGGEDIYTKLREAVAFIEKNQGGDGQNKGGWRYIPKQNDADLSVTVCLLQALRAARNAGIKVHQSTIDSARDYVVRNFDATNGGFTYQPSDSYGRQSFALTAAGMVALQSVGNYRSFQHGEHTIYFERSVRYLEATRPDRHDKIRARDYCNFSFWYGHYYAAQAMRQWGLVSPETWENWNERNRRHFGALQDEKTGAWVDEIGNYKTDEAAYATAMACLILSIPNNYLPIFQQ